MDIDVIKILLFVLFIMSLIFTARNNLDDKIPPIISTIVGILFTISGILFFISMRIEAECNTNSTNIEKTLVYEVDLSAVPKDYSKLEIPVKTITGKNGETIKASDKTINIGKVITTNDKSKAGIYDIKKYWKCFYNKERITYVYKPKERK